jgi:hypothetical protein
MVFKTMQKSEAEASGITKSSKKIRKLMNYMFLVEILILLG